MTTINCNKYLIIFTLYTKAKVFLGCLPFHCLHIFDSVSSNHIRHLPIQNCYSGVFSPLMIADNRGYHIFTARLFRWSAERVVASNSWNFSATTSFMASSSYGINAIIVLAPAVMLFSIPILPALSISVKTVIIMYTDQNGSFPSHC